MASFIICALICPEYPRPTQTSHKLKDPFSNHHLSGALIDSMVFVRVLNLLRYALTVLLISPITTPHHPPLPGAQTRRFNLLFTYLSLTQPTSNK